MRLVFTADLQIHEHQKWSRVLPNGRNSRLQNGLDCLEQAFVLAKGGVLVINGDLFHDRKHLSIEVIHATCEVFQKHSDVPVILNIGNHDQFLRSGAIHSLSMFNGMSNVRVIDSPCDIPLGEDLRLYIHPFTTDLQAFRQWSSALEFRADEFSVMVVHQGVEGSTLAQGVKSKGGLSLGDLRFDEVGAVFLGHYHRPQALARNVWYIGSPYEIDEGEAGEDKRFITLSDESGSWVVDTVPVVGMPKHKRWDNVDTFTLDAKEADFNTVECDTREEAEAIEETGCKSIMRRADVVSLGDVEIADVSIEEALKLSLTRKHNRPDLFEKKLKRRLPA